MSTLDHLTQGRIGWNIVTSYLDSAARNFGLRHPLEHDTRYDHRRRVPRGALQALGGILGGRRRPARPRARRLHRPRASVHRIEHNGPFFTVPGIHLSEPSPSGRRCSTRPARRAAGSAFAAENAESIFVSGPDTSRIVTRPGRADLRDALRGVGPQALRPLVYKPLHRHHGRDEPRRRIAKYDKYRQLRGPRGRPRNVVGLPRHRPRRRTTWTNPIEQSREQRRAIGWSRPSSSGDPDRGDVDGARRRPQWGSIGGPAPDRRRLQPAEVADELQEWAESTDVDGFNLTFAVRPDSFVGHRRPPRPRAPAPWRVPARLIARGRSAASSSAARTCLTTTAARATARSQRAETARRDLHPHPRGDHHGDARPRSAAGACRQPGALARRQRARAPRHPRRGPATVHPARCSERCDHRRRTIARRRRGCTGRDRQ